eukprot:5356374-Karenia_brevis.AAC.1
MRMATERAGTYELSLPIINQSLPFNYNLDSATKMAGVGISRLLSEGTASMSAASFSIFPATPAADNSD